MTRSRMIYLQMFFLAFALIDVTADQETTDPYIDVEIDLTTANQRITKGLQFPGDSPEPSPFEISNETSNAYSNKTNNTKPFTSDDTDTLFIPRLETGADKVGVEEIFRPYEREVIERKDYKIEPCKCNILLLDELELSIIIASTLTTFTSLVVSLFFCGWKCFVPSDRRWEVAEYKRRSKLERDSEGKRLEEMESDNEVTAAAFDLDADPTETQKDK